MSAAEHQTLRLLDGRYVLERRTQVQDLADNVLAIVRGPDGGACMRRREGDEATSEEAWVALWNGDVAHPPDATGMCAAIVAPLAAGAVPVWVAASYDGDLVLVPAARVDEAVDLLRRAGHVVTG